LFCLAIISINCNQQKPSKSKASGGKDTLSSAWDDTSGKKGGGSAALDDPSLRGMSPEEFASQEEWDKRDWDGGKKESKKDKKKKRKSKHKVRVGSATCDWCN